MVQYRPSAAPEIGIEAEWEIEARDLQLFNKLGEGEFGEVRYSYIHHASKLDKGYIAKIHVSLTQSGYMYTMRRPET